MRISDWSSDVCSSDLIASQIKEIQNATNDAVTAIKDITATIAEIDTIGAAIAAPVEEQSAATQEISRNVQEAAVGEQQAGSNITGVHSAIGQTSKLGRASCRERECQYV